MISSLDRSQMTTKGQAGLDEILAKSCRLMAMRGYRGTSMRDLAGATDRSLAGLYHYFKTKEDLLYLINYQGFSSLRTTAEAALRAPLDPDEKLRRFIRNHIEYFASHLDEMKVMMFGTQELDTRRGQQINALKSGYADAGHRIVSEYLRQRGPGSRVPSSEAARKTYLLFGMMNWIFGWYSPRVHGSAEVLAEDIYLTFTRGAYPARKARKS